MATTSMMDFVVDCNEPVAKSFDEVDALHGTTLQEKFEAVFAHRPDVVRRLQSFEHDYEISPRDEKAGSDRAAVAGDHWDKITQEFRTREAVLYAAEHVEGGKS